MLTLISTCGLVQVLRGSQCRRKSSALCVRICANKVVAGGRLSALLARIRPADPRQFASAHQIVRLEGLAVAIPWGFESPFRTNLRSHDMQRASSGQATQHHASAALAKSVPPKRPSREGGRPSALRASVFGSESPFRTNLEMGLVSGTFSAPTPKKLTDS